jgi:hypothetical protein
VFDRPHTCSSFRAVTFRSALIMACTFSSRAAITTSMPALSAGISVAPGTWFLKSSCTCNHQSCHVSNVKHRDESFLTNKHIHKCMVRSSRNLVTQQLNVIQCFSAVVGGSQETSDILFRIWEQYFGHERDRCCGTLDVQHKHILQIGSHSKSSILILSRTMHKHLIRMTPKCCIRYL